MSIHTINKSTSIEEVGRLLHWIIDDMTLNDYEKSTAFRAADKKVKELLGKNTPQDHTILGWLVICQNWNEELENFIKTLVLEYNIDINQKDNRGYTPIIWAVIFDRQRAVRLLLSLGADPNIQQSEGKDSYYFAKECDNQRSIQELDRFNS